MSINGSSQNTPNNKTKNLIVPKMINKVVSPVRKADSKNEKLRRRRGQAKCDLIIEYDDSEFVGKTNDEDDEDETFVIDRSQSVENLKQSLIYSGEDSIKSQGYLQYLLQYSNPYGTKQIQKKNLQI